MLQKITSKRLLSGIVTFLFLSSGVKMFLAGNYFTNPWPFFGFIFLVVSCDVFLKSSFLRFFPKFVSAVVLYYYYVPLKMPFGWRWLQEIVIFLKERFTHLFSGSFLLQEQVNLFFIIGIVVFFAGVMIHFHHWILPFATIILYLISLRIVMNLDVFPSIYYLLFFTFLFIMVENTSRHDFRLPFTIAIVAGVSFLSGYLIVYKSDDLFNQMITATTSLRNKMQRTNFYAFVREYGHGNSTLNISGYSENDEFLGGAMVQDHSLAFTAYQKKAHYWRVNTKDYYSGKGWLAKNNAMEQRSFGEKLQGNEWNLPIDLNASEMIHLELPDDVDYLPLPTGVTEIFLDTDSNNQDLGSLKYTYNLLQEKVVFSDWGLFTEKVFNLTWYEIQYTEDKLREAPMSNRDFSAYLQVPVTVPQRVKDLAMEVTREAKNDYDRAKAIENYLAKNNEFRYSLKDVEEVPKDQDYVDYFLFESKVGYCQHFASSMIILLREVGIPARWASGFSSGKKTGETNDYGDKYEIYNKDAHVWPEVYFEGYGWIPFEPTTTFQNPQELEMATGTSDSQETPRNTEASSDSKNQELMDSSSKEEVKTGDTQSQNEEAVKEEEKQNLSHLWWILVLLAMMIMLAFRKMVYLVGKFVKLSIGSHPSLEKEYLSLAAILEKTYPRPTYQDLSAYGSTLPQNFQEDFGRLTLAYEKITYGGNAGRKITNEEKVAFKHLYKCLLTEKIKRNKKNTTEK